MQVRVLRYIEHPHAYIRTHGSAYGMKQYELCFDKDDPTTQLVREAYLNNNVLFLEIVPGGDENNTISIFKRPYRNDKNELCITLPLRQNELWEELYMKYRFKPIIVRIFVKTEGGEPS